jgi:hypothetical protein
MRRLFVIATLFALPTALPAQRQQGTPTPSAAASRDSLTSEEALIAVRGRLLLLVEAQEAYFADHGSYTTDLSALQMAPTGKARPRVVLNITHANRRAWRATGLHVGYPAKSCVIFGGRVEDFPIAATKAEGRRPTVTQKGEPICDAP